MSARRERAAKRPAKPIFDVGDHVMLGRAGDDPVAWWIAKVLWTDWSEVLVHQEGWCGQNPHNALHSCDLVRCFGTLEHCCAEKRKAEKLVRDAANQCRDCEEMAGDLRRKLTDVFEVVAAKALEASGAARMAGAA